MKTFLNIRWKPLFVRYGILYVAFAGALFFSGNHIIFFSIYFWLIFGTLILVEKFGSSTFIDANAVYRKAWFILNWTIPFASIKEIRQIYVGVANQKALTVIYKQQNNKESKDILLVDLYGKNGVSAFISAIRERVPDVNISEEAIRFLAPEGGRE